MVMAACRRRSLRASALASMPLAPACISQEARISTKACAQQALQHGKPCFDMLQRRATCYKDELKLLSRSVVLHVSRACWLEHNAHCQMAGSIDVDTSIWDNDAAAKGVLVDLDFDDGSDDTVHLAPHHKAAGMSLNGDRSFVHDVCAHGVKHCHLAASQEHLCTSWHLGSTGLYLLLISCCGEERRSCPVKCLMHVC